MSVYAPVMLRPLSILPVEKSDLKGTVLGGAGILGDLTQEATDVFGPLKTVLAVVSIAYENYQVRLRLLVRILL